MKQTDSVILSDTDLAGPLVFCLLFGAVLLLVINPLAQLHVCHHPICPYSQGKSTLAIFMVLDYWGVPACMWY